ncbi:hypothetical protein Q1695_007107 [Nippostrongylus brasiliensis]|nr:hypothetical protein Q1695_007107 [Nippostrongylus brasiliensis]
MFCRRSKLAITVLFIGAGVLTIFGTYELATRSSFGHVRVRQVPATDNKRYQFHPFENSCKFPLPNIYAKDVAGWFSGERLRQLQCPYEDVDLATMDSEGYMYVHPHHAHYKNVMNDIKCKVVFVEGGIRDNTTKLGHKTIVEVATFEAPENTRFYANGDVYFIRCFNNATQQVFQKIFAGMRDLQREKNKIYITDDMESFDQFGGRRKNPSTKEKPNRYSIDILTIDSTSRTMFMRHMPRTVEMMTRLGYEMFYGYTKVGDNSMVNLEPILAGDIPEALVEPMNDTSGDINPQWILPTNKALDPSLLPFLSKIMEKEYGCKTMFNDDIGTADRGIFHYPSGEFQPGFTTPPADHYYRAYYLALYKNWTYGPCKDGGQIQREFFELWRRFAQRYKDICHFGFTFITTLTHEDGYRLETMDEYLRSSLENLHITGALDNSVSIIMGDHGNRIGAIQFSYTGRIEERMPLMAIRLPSDFKQLYPMEYNNFLTNKWKLTSNFDIHKTLQDVVRMSFGKKRTGSSSNGRGISLFDEISANRSCRDAYIAENFCTCLIKRTIGNQSKDEIKKREELNKKKFKDTITAWLRVNGLKKCFNYDKITIGKEAATLGINPLVRHGLRSKAKTDEVESARKKEPRMDYLYHEFVASIPTHDSQSMELLFRIEEEVATGVFNVAFEPSIRKSLPTCQEFSVFDVCDCLKS